MSSGSTSNNTNFSYHNRPTVSGNPSSEQQQQLSSLSSIPPNDPSPSSQGPLPSFLSHPTSLSSGARLPANRPTQAHGSTAPQPPQLNPRSCTTCRRRKVRCNKRNPCSNCIKAGIECIFPAPGRAPRKSKKPADTELLARLRRLEGVVQALGADVDDDGNGGGGIDTAAILAAASTPAAQAASPTVPQDQAQGDRDKELAQSKRSMCPDFADADPRKIHSRKIDQEFGRLVVDDGKSRYVSNRFWASLGDEIEEMRYILDASSSDEEEDSPSVDNSGNGSSYSDGHDGFLFGFRSVAHNLRNFHPTPTQAFILWETYKENVAPLVPIFHFPTTEKIYLEAPSNLNTISKTTETMLFSIYYSAATSMTAEQCRSLLSEERDTILTRYRFAMEQSLARANILNSQSLMVLQALTLFLICVRRQDDTRYVWTMTAIVQRIAQGMGLHRDGTTFALKPFETEMRRRLWWHICILDIRAAEDHGVDPAIHEAFYDTRLPLNINDEDISPDSTELPEDRIGCTEMTFSLIRCEVTLAVRRLHYLPPNSKCPESNEFISVEQREDLIEALNKRLEERYLKYCDMSVPIFWVCATIARLIIAKTWLVVHHPMTRHDHGAGLPQDTRDRLFLTSVEVIEFSHLLETNENTSKWGWLFRTYIQWHAVAFILSELCVRARCPAVERAWRAVEAVYDGWETRAKERRGMLWRPMRKLMIRARKFQAEQVKQPQLLYPQQSPAAAGSGSTPPATANTFTTQPNPQPQEKSESQPSPELDIDLGKGMTGLIDEFAPGAFEQASRAFHRANNTPATQYQSNMDVDVNMDPPGNQYVSQWLDSNPKTNSSASPIPMFPNQTEWDQAIRDFQMDVQQANGPPPLGGVSDWFE